MASEMIKIRAYYLWKTGYGYDDMDRYYSALHTHHRIITEHCYELSNSVHMCRYCCDQIGTISTPYIFPDTYICNICFNENSKEELISKTNDVYPLAH
jgi:hypothetical protein